VKGAAQLLNPSGVAIMQIPINRYNYETPFNHMFEKVFDDLEHLFIFTNRSIELLAERSSLFKVAEEVWNLAHEIVVLRKKS